MQAKRRPPHKTGDAFSASVSGPALSSPSVRPSQLPGSERILVEYTPTDQEAQFLGKIEAWRKAGKISDIAEIEVRAILAGGITAFDKTAESQQRFLSNEATLLGFKLIGTPRLRR